MKPSGYFTVLCIVGALANCAKADIVAAQELPNGRVIVNDPTAYIGSEQNHVKTPWMIVSPDAMQGFANDFTTNAISLVSEDGTNFYAHIETKDSEGNIDRTKVIHFTVDENGIPSKTGEEIDTTESGETANFKRMQNRKLIGVLDGFLYFAPIDSNNSNKSYLHYNPETNTKYTHSYPDYRASYQNGSDLYIVRYQKVDGEQILRLRKAINPRTNSMSDTSLSGIEDSNIAVTGIEDQFYIASGEGNIRAGSERMGLNRNVIAKLPGPVSGLSNNGDEVFATTTATNAFYNVTLGQYNVVADENDNPIPMVPQTQEGLVRVIDNRELGGKFLYVTATGIYSVD